MRTQLSVTAALAAFVVAVLAGCSGNDAKPCNTCPQVAGNWTFQFEAAGEPSAACAQLQRTTPPASFSVTQVGSSLGSELEGVEVRGTLYDTYDFGLSGTANGEDGGVTSVSLNGRYVPNVAGTDAGERLQGSFNGNYTSGETSCVVSRGYTATRAP